MSAARALRLLNSWETVRFELLNTRISDLGLQIEGSPLEPFIMRLYRELEAKKLLFQPRIYLSDGWGCPDQVPVIGVPFYLADRRLSRIEEEQTGEIETPELTMMLLRHEAGHAVNYAYRLYRRAGWVEMFGKFRRPYRDTFQPNPFSRHFVRHIVHHQYGRTYAQKHPDEDFAETFAVWLTPRSSWRRRYHNWPALRKLDYVNDLMRGLQGVQAHREDGPPYMPVEKMGLLLAEHYGQRAERYREAAEGYVDDKLRAVFPPLRGKGLAAAGDLLRKQRRQLFLRVSRWSGLGENEVATLLDKLQDRAYALDLHYARGQAMVKVMDTTALATALAMDFAYTGRLTG
jgi:Putative zinc-binding metallo-peptidase